MYWDTEHDWIDIGIMATAAQFNRPIQGMSYVLRNLDPEQQYQVKLKSKYDTLIMMYT